MADAFVIETADLRKHYDGVEALRGLSLQVPRGLDLRVSRAQRRRQDDDDQGAARHGPADQRHAPRVRPRRPTTPEASVEIRRRTGFVSDDKDLYDYMTVGGDDPLHGALLSALARRPRAALSAQVRAAAGREGQGALARHAHQARVAARALPRRRAA